MRSLRQMIVAVVCTVAVAGAIPATASACSLDDSNYFDSFLDTVCLQSQTNTALDAQGGLRLSTNGAPATTSWDTDSDFDSGVTYQSMLFGPQGLSTLTRTGTGAAAALALPSSAFAIGPDAASVVDPATSTVGDGDNVDGPSVVKVGSTYVMFYAGSPEDGTPRAIYTATSANGVAWTRANGGAAVLTGTALAFDRKGVSGPEVIYDATDTAAPYKMWFSGQGPTFGGIGYATSLDGISWTKYTGGGPLPVPVLDHGEGGSADSFSAADPSVIKDGSTWKMWYTGDDSSKKRIAYATSPDGVVWSKGGKVISPEDAGVSANLAHGAYAPTVWKSGSDYNMLLAGRKLVSGTTFQTKILGTTSSDGINWGGPSPAINPSGASSNFDYSNLDGPDVLPDPGSSTPYKAYYAGNTIDANGNFHTRIGHATSSSGNSFSKVTSGAGVSADGSVLDVATAEVAFDARSASGASVSLPTGAPVGKKFVGFYSGQRGSDFKSRIGGATSSDGSSWTKFSDGTQTGGSLLPLGNAPANFDLGGQRDPWLLYDSAAGSPYRLYFSAINSTGVRSVGTATTTQDADKQPINASWTTPTKLTFAGSGYSAGGIAHPSVVKDGATYRMYFTAIDSGGAVSIGYSASADGVSFSAPGTQILTAGVTGTFDAGGVKDPAVWKAGVGDYRMVYTAVSGQSTERLGYATSADGAAWTKASPALLLDAGLTPGAFDERGVAASGVATDGATTHVFYSGLDASGRKRGGHATSNATALSPRGAATYQLGDTATSVRDFRGITRNSSGATELWLSYLQPYSSAGNEFWSAYFPVTALNNPETLNFLLTVRAIRWQARLSGPQSPPALGSVEVESAPVSFWASGGAMTGVIAPPPAAGLSGWTSAKINASMFQPAGSGSGSGSASVTVLDAATSAPLTSAALNTGGDTTIDLSGIPPALHPQLRLSFALTSSDGTATPRINSLQLVFNTAPAPPALTLAATPASVVYGQSVTLTGRLTRGASPLAGQSVAITSQPTGAAAPAVVTSAVTDASGAFSAVVKPVSTTAYRAVFSGAAEPVVSVPVAHLVKLRVKRRGTKGYVTGSVGPTHRGLAVRLQQKKGSRWVTIKKLKTSSKSTFKATVKKLKKTGKYQFRALTPADADHLAGTSAIAWVDAYRVSLTVKRSGRTLTLTGKVSPGARGKTVEIRQLKAGRWVRIAKVKLSSRSTFKLKKKFAAGTYDLRAQKAGTKRLWPGMSKVRSVTVP